MGEQASERAGQARQRERPPVAEPGAFHALSSDKGLGPLEETIGKGDEAHAGDNGESVDEGSRVAHEVDGIVGDDEESCNGHRGGEDDDPDDDGEDGAEDVHCVAPFVAGASGDKYI